MIDSNDKLSMCDEMWNRVKSVYELNKQLTELDYCLAADRECDGELLNSLHDILKSC